MAKSKVEINAWGVPGRDAGCEAMDKPKVEINAWVFAVMVELKRAFPRGYIKSVEFQLDPGGEMLVRVNWGEMMNTAMVTT